MPRRTNEAVTERAQISSLQHICCCLILESSPKTLRGRRQWRGRRKHRRFAATKGGGAGSTRVAAAPAAGRVGPAAGTGRPEGGGNRPARTGTPGKVDRIAGGPTGQIKCAPLFVCDKIGGGIMAGTPGCHGDTLKLKSAPYNFIA